MAKSSAAMLGQPSPLALSSARAAGYIAFVVAWELMASVLPDHLFPSLWSVIERIWALAVEGHVAAHLGYTMARLLIGLGIAFVIGLALGILMGVRPFWDEMLSDYVNVALSVPALIWSILMGMWFGLHPIGPVLAVILGAFPVVTINVYQGVRNIDKDLIDMAFSYKVSRSRVIRRIIIPSLFPYLFAAARYSLGLGWKIVVITEIYAAANGMGWMIQYNFDAFSIRGVMAWAFIFTAIVLGLEQGVLEPLERRLFHWRPQGTIR